MAIDDILDKMIKLVRKGMKGLRTDDTAEAYAQYMREMDKYIKMMEYYHILGEGSEDVEQWVSHYICNMLPERIERIERDGSRRMAYILELKAKELREKYYEFSQYGGLEEV